MNRELTIKLLEGIFLVIAVIAATKVKSQICTGSLGDPVVNVTFGAGDGVGRPLPGKITSYTYVGNDCPNDGSYTIINSSFNCFGGWYNITRDHTPNDVNGYMMLVNASFTPSDFYIDTVKNLCGNTTYEFGSWITNVSSLNPCSPNPILPKLVFNIETISGQVLGTFSTGDIGLTASLVWKQYGLFFTTPANTNSVVIRITNSAPGGCGNDIALDDITFRPCGPVISAITNNASQTELNICEVAATLLF